MTTTRGLARLVEPKLSPSALLNTLKNCVTAIAEFSVEINSAATGGHLEAVCFTTKE